MAYNSLGAAHGRVTAYVANHATASALALAVLVVLCVILLITTIVYHRKWKKAGGDKFTSPNGTWTGGLHSNWQNGSVHDQAYFGPGLQHYSQLGQSYMPAVSSKSALRSQLKGNRHMHVARQKAAAHRAAVRRMQARRPTMHREGLAPGPANPLTPDDADQGYSDWTYDDTACPDTGAYDRDTGVMVVTDETVGRVWDPDAIAEAQALASVGSYVNDPSGDEMAFQAAIGSAMNANAAANTMTDAQLSGIMAGGTAP